MKVTEKKKAMLAFYKTNSPCSMQKVADEFNCSREYVRVVLAEFGISKEDKIQRRIERKANHYAEQKKRVIKELSPEKTGMDISRATGINPITVYRILKNEGCERHYKREDIERLLEKTNLSYSEIANELGVSLSHVAQCSARSGIRKERYHRGNE